MEEEKTSEIKKIEGIKFTGSRSENVQNGVCFEKCELDIKDVKRLVVPSNRCIFEVDKEDKETTKMSIYVNKTQNYWGFPSSKYTILESKDKMGIGTFRQGETLQFCSYGNWVGGHEGGCYVIFKIIFPYHIEKITRRDELYGDRSCPENFAPIDSWEVDKDENEIKFDSKSLTPSEICYEKVEFMFSLEKFYPEVHNSRGGGVICMMLSFLSVEDLLISIPFVSKTFNLASKFVLLFQKSFSRNEYLYMLSYDYRGDTGLNEHELHEICKHNPHFDFTVQVPYSREKEMCPLMYYFHKGFKNEDFLDLLLSKISTSERADKIVGNVLEIYLGNSQRVETHVVEKLLKDHPNIDPNGKTFLYACMGGDSHIVNLLISLPGFGKEGTELLGPYDVGSTIENLISCDFLPHLLEYNEKMSGDILNDNKLLLTSITKQSMKCLKYFIESKGFRPTQEALSKCFQGPPNVEIVKLILKSNPDIDPSSCLFHVLGADEEIYTSERKEELTRMFMSHPKVSNGSALSAYVRLGKDFFPQFEELYPKCTKEEKNFSLLNGCISCPIEQLENTLKVVEVFLRNDVGPGLDFSSFVKKIVKPTKEVFWYEGVQFVANNPLMKKVLETPGACDNFSVDDDEDYIKSLVETTNLDIISYLLEKKKMTLTLDLLTQIAENLYYDKPGVTKFFIENFPKFDLSSIDDNTAFLLYQKCYEKELREYLLSNDEFMKKITDERIFSVYAEDLEGLKLVLKKVTIVPTAQTFARFCRQNAASRGLDVVKWIVDTYDIDVSWNNNDALGGAVEWGRGDYVEYLMKKDPVNVDPSTHNNQFLITLLRNHYWACADCEKIVKLFLADERCDPSTNENEALKLSLRVSSLCFKMLFDHPKVRKALTMEIINELLLGCVSLGDKNNKTAQGVIAIIFEDGKEFVDLEKIDEMFLIACVESQVVDTIRYIVEEKKVKVTKASILKAEELNKTEIMEILVKNSK